MFNPETLVNKTSEDLEKMLSTQASKLKRVATAYAKNKTSEAKAAVTVEKIEYMDITMAMLRTKDHQDGPTPAQFVAAMTAADRIIDQVMAVKAPVVEAKAAAIAAPRSQEIGAYTASFDAVLAASPTSAGVKQAVAPTAPTSVTSQKRDTLVPLVQKKQAISVERARVAIQESATCGNPAKVSEHSALMAATLATGYYNNMNDVDRLKPGMPIAAPSDEQIRKIVDFACKFDIAPQGKFTYASIKDLHLQTPETWPAMAQVHNRQTVAFAKTSRN